MMILEAKRLGLYVITLDPSIDCPSSSISDEVIAAGFHDGDAIRRLAEKTDVITYEYEHINAGVLAELENRGHKIYPSVSSLLLIQDKFTQKTKLSDGGLNVPRFKSIETLEELQKYADNSGFPVMLKSRKDGYDGKGNFLIREKSEIETGFNSLGGKLLMTEEFIDFLTEVSVIAVRGINGEKAVYPIACNTHRNNILDTTEVPAALPSESLRVDILEAAERVMDIFEGVGTFGIEMFIGKNNKIYINEVAPRPHNSGHYTIEGCRANQFENHIRAITGLPLGETKLLHNFVLMRNLLGQSNGMAKTEGTEEAYRIYNGVNIHVYGKRESKTGRKMGHYTITGDSPGQVREIDAKISGIVKITGGEIDL
ncbi:MAG: 5-(carboxyamino)imidazole ribonucleotide synthase [Oscillospiraceae bacterium]|nr:5-(carboxyamino)imidazole ribonucleotide synthase [Oscillospiraceae bacterium]